MNGGENDVDDDGLEDDNPNSGKTSRNGTSKTRKVEDGAEVSTRLIEGKSSKKNASKKRKIDEEAEPITKPSTVKESKSTGSKKKRQNEEVTVASDDIPAKVSGVLKF